MKKRIVVTGGTGLLGRILVPKLVEAGHEVTVLSRSSTPAIPAGVASVVGDVVSGRGIAEAATGKDVIVHAATSTSSNAVMIEVVGTRTMLDAARRHNVGHFVYLSIVGVDDQPMSYYRGKREAEAAIANGAVPFTIRRTTQLHELFEQGLDRISRLPLIVIPRGISFQPIAGAEVADLIAADIASPPAGVQPGIGGPEVLALRELVDLYLAATRKRRLVAEVPIPTRVIKAFQDGVHLAPDERVGTVTWEEHLASRRSRTSHN